MTIYEDNLAVLEKTHKDVYATISGHAPCSDRIIIDDAYNGETYIAIQREGGLISMNSLYSPSHAAERFTEQFKQFRERYSLVMFGFGDGMILRNLLTDTHPIEWMIVYEPSMELFNQVIHRIDVRDILVWPKLIIVIKGINDDQFGDILDKKISINNWKTFYYVRLPIYQDLFLTEYSESYQQYVKSVQLKRSLAETSVLFARQGLLNEIYAQKWIIKSKSFEYMKEKFPVGFPCIIVSAGPSLEKNVDKLRAAKGKACIIAVDTVAQYLLNCGIVPDLLCTIDPMKETKYFKDERLKYIPILVSTASNHYLLEQLEDFQPIYFHTSAAWYRTILKENDCNLLDGTLGGSVATVSFMLALELGFRTIILVGQDLAYEHMQLHAGEENLSEEAYQKKILYKVKGYHGTTVMTSVDFKIYIDWFEKAISALTSDYTIINATEGGARIEGTIQLPLEEAIHQYCTLEYDYELFLQNLPLLFATDTAKKRLYNSLKNGKVILQQIAELSKQGFNLAKQALSIMNAPDYSEEGFLKLETKIDQLLSKITKMELYDMIQARAVEKTFALSDAARNASLDAEVRRKSLYEGLESYFNGIYQAALESIELWEQSLDEIGITYGFK